MKKNMSAKGGCALGAKKIILFTIISFLFLGQVNALSNLNLDNAQMKIWGANNKQFGDISLTSVGDMNNDGYEDFAVGYTPNNLQDGVYLFYGQADLINIDLQTQSASATFIGNALQGYNGPTLGGGGDINNDGFDDLLVGASFEDTSTGRTYIIYGSAVKFSGVNQLSDFPYFYGEAAGNYSGIAVDIVGDVNGDNFDDLIIGAHWNDSRRGAVYLIYGQSALFTASNSLVNYTKFTGENTFDLAGGTVAAAGDVNNDNYNDFLITADAYNSYQGKVYLIYGQAGNYANPFALNGANVSFVGEETGDGLGTSLSPVGDVDNDGYDDFLIGSILQGPGSIDQGAYLIYGRSLSGNLSIMDSAVKFIEPLAEADDSNRYFALGGADINHDGFSDFAIGVPHYNNHQGIVYLLLGGSTRWTNLSNFLTANYSFTTNAENAMLGDKSTYCDYNGDGFQDLLMALPQDSTNGVSAGAAYLAQIYYDADHDGVAGAGAGSYLAGSDCNDSDATVYENQTYYSDADNDGYGSTITTSVCQSVPPTGYVTNNTDCSDTDATVNTNQTYYQDLDGDGLGSTITTSVCSSTAPAGYVTNSNDLNDTVKDISTIAGTANGNILITYINNDTETIDVFANTTTKNTIISQHESQYYIALSTNGKKIALVDIYNLSVLSTKTLSKTKKYSKNTLKLKTIRSKDAIVIVSKKKAQVLLSLLTITTDNTKLNKKDQVKTTNKNIKPSKTKITKNTIYLRNKNSKTLEKYLVTKKLNLLHS